MSEWPTTWTCPLSPLDLHAGPKGEDEIRHILESTFKTLLKDKPPTVDAMHELDQLCGRRPDAAVEEHFRRWDAVTGCRAPRPKRPQQRADRQ